MNDTLWITLPVETWRKLFDRATEADRSASDFLRVLIEYGVISRPANPAPQVDELPAQGARA